MNHLKFGLLSGTERDGRRPVGWRMGVSGGFSQEQQLYVLLIEYSTVKMSLADLVLALLSCRTVKKKKNCTGRRFLLFLIFEVMRFFFFFFFLPLCFSLSVWALIINVTDWASFSCRGNGEAA